MTSDPVRRDRMRALLIGGIVVASAALAAARRRRPALPQPRVHAAGLAAFEGAPCYRELVEDERASRPAPSA